MTEYLEGLITSVWWLKTGQKVVRIICDTETIILECNFSIWSQQKWHREYCTYTVQLQWELQREVLIMLKIIMTENIIENSCKQLFFTFNS